MPEGADRDILTSNPGNTTMNLSNFSLLLTAGILALTAYLSLQAREDTNAKLNKLPKNRLMKLHFRSYANLFLFKAVYFS